MEIISLDLVGSLPILKKYNRVLVMMNRFSKIAHYISITMNITSKELLRTYGIKYSRTLDFSKRL